MMRRLRRFVLALAAGSCAACGGSQNMLAPGGPAARRLADVGWFVLIVFSVVSVVMWLLILWLALRRRGTLAEHAAWDASGDTRWITIGGFTIPVIILAVTFVLTLQTMAAFPMGDNEMRAPPPMLRVIGHQWWWELQYVIGGEAKRVVTANEIHIPAGRPVDIELQTADVIHSFWVPELHGKVDLVPDKVNRIRLQADAPADFDRWLANQRADAVPPATPESTRGEALFLSRACILCHTIRGTAAHGSVGPDLTHLASRRRIAGNAFENNTGNLAGWITHAQALKPTAKMPNLSVFSGEELRDVVTYLQTLQ